MNLKKFADPGDHVTTSLKPDVQIVDLSLGICCLSLAIVLAGTGDLNALRLFKMLRWKCEFDTRYGTHMALNSAIGLLFMGGGKCSFGRTHEDIAMLVASFYPRFPSKTTDNQFHLQAMRHFYALATRDRLVQAIDADSGASVSVNIIVDFKDVHIPPREFKIPGLLTNLQSVPSSIRLKSDEYFESTIDFNSLKLNDMRIFVKKRRRSSEDSTDQNTWDFLLGDPVPLAKGRTLNSVLYTLLKDNADKPPTMVEAAHIPSLKLNETLLTRKQLQGLLSRSSNLSSLARDARLLKTFYETFGRCNKVYGMTADFVSWLVESIEALICHESITEGARDVWFALPCGNTMDADRMDMS